MLIILLAFFSHLALSFLFPLFLSASPVVRKIVVYILRMAADAETILQDERIAQRLARVNGQTYRVPFESAGPVHG